MSKLRLSPATSLSTGHTRSSVARTRPRPPTQTQPGGGAVAPTIWTLVKTSPNAYLRTMFKSFEFCVPTKASTVPDGPEWLHEIKYDGYRLRVERDGDRVRLITRDGYNWTDRYPWIVEAALKNRVRQFVIDGEAVVLA